MRKIYFNIPFPIHPSPLFFQCTPMKNFSIQRNVIIFALCMAIYFLRNDTEKTLDIEL